MFSGGFASALQLTYLLGSLTIQSFICQPPTAPTIAEPIDGSSFAANTPFAVSGSGPTESAIIISDNGTDVVSVQADETNHFSANVTMTTEGEHTISVKSVRTCGTATGDTITVTITEGPVIPVDPVDPIDPVDPTTPTQPTNPPTEETPTAEETPATEEPVKEVPPPDTTSDGQGTSDGLFLSIHNPADNSVTTDSSVFINGSTNSSSKISITVNGSLVARTLVDQTSFGISTPLSVGNNEIVIKAEGANGSASVVLNVVRQTENQETAWYRTEAGQTTIKVAAISVISILIIIVIIGIILL